MDHSIIFTRWRPFNACTWFFGLTDLSLPSNLHLDQFAIFAQHTVVTNTQITISRDVRRKSCMFAADVKVVVVVVVVV